MDLSCRRRESEERKEEERRQNRGEDGTRWDNTEENEEEINGKQKENILIWNEKRGRGNQSCPCKQREAKEMHLRKEIRRKSVA